MQCLRCRQTNPPEARYCLSCGAALGSGCPACAAVIPAGAKFCPECGAAAAQSRAPLSYTPPHLRAAILDARSSIVGERKQVTVVFCDIVRSTSLAAEAGPESWHSIVDRFFAFALEQVHGLGGTVNQFLGDGFMALFGAPVAHEDHRRRALLAALRVSAWPEFDVRIGVNSGSVVVGAIGDDLRLDYTAFGDTTVLAARLQAAAQPREVLVSEELAASVEGYFVFDETDEVEVKERVVRPYRLVGVGRRVARIDDADALAPFTGRTPELELLERAMDVVEAGEGQIVGIVGDAGLGKSRLVLEFALGVRSKTRVLEGRCVSYGAGVPYGPLLDIVRELCHLDPDGNPDAAARVDRALETLGVDPEHGPFLLHALGVFDDVGAMAAADPPTIKGRTFDALRRLLLAHARTEPLVLVIEDAHWVDRTTEEFLSEFADDVASARILMLVTYRPGYDPPWTAKSFATQIALRPLDVESSRVVVGWGFASADEDSLRSIVALGEGNPFFLEELARARRQPFDGSDGASVPKTVQDVLAARVDALDPPARHAIQIASVIGRDFDLGLLEDLWDTADSLALAIRELKRLEFVREQHGAGGRGFAFKHALTREVAYESLLEAQRHVLHERIAAELEQLYRDRLHEQYEVLAHHYARSSNRERAVSYLELASRKAAARHALEEALEYFYAALAILEDMPDSDENRRRRLELVFDQTAPFHWLHRHHEFYELLLRHEPVVVALDDEGLSAAYHGRLAHRLLVFGDYTSTIEAAESVLLIPATSRTAFDTGLAYGAMQWSYTMLGDYARGIEFHEKWVEQLEIAFDPMWHMYTYGGAAIAHLMEGRWSAAMAKIDSAMATGTERSDHGTVSFAAAFGAWVLQEQRDWRRALDYATVARDMAPTVYFRGFALAFLASSLCHVGAADQGIPVLEEVVPMVKASGHEMAWEIVAWRLVDAYVADFRLEQAREAASELQAAAMQTRTAFFLGASSRVLAEIELVKGNLEASLAEAARAVDVLRASRSESQLALALAARGRVQRRLGAAAAGRADLDEALAIMNRLGTLEVEGLRLGLTTA